MKKLTLTLDQINWLEATWVEEIVTQVPVEKETEIDGEIVKKNVLEDKVETTPIHCESFSGHPEHIAMLRAKALEFETELTDFEDLISECEGNFIAPTEEELAKEKLLNDIQEATHYLATTDWVNDYKLRHDLGWELIPEDSSKWLIIAKRAEAKEFIKVDKVL